MTTDVNDFDTFIARWRRLRLAHLPQNDLADHAEDLGRQIGKLYLGPVVAVSRVDAHLVGGDRRLRPVSVVLHLENPAVANGYLALHDVADRDVDSEPFAERLHANHRIALAPCAADLHVRRLVGTKQRLNRDRQVDNRLASYM